jgi:hypothetical protein
MSNAAVFAVIYRKFAAAAPSLPQKSSVLVEDKRKKRRTAIYNCQNIINSQKCQSAPGGRRSDRHR